MLSREDVHLIREDFPILSQKINGHPLVYLDNGATTQVPVQVLEAIVGHYKTSNANVHRGIHTLSEKSTTALEVAREKIQSYIGAKNASEVVFTKGTTDSINKVACMLEASHILSKNDVVAVSALEHHANFVPWQQMCSRIGAQFKVVPINERGDIDLDALDKLLERDNVKVVAMTHVSNVTGTVVPVSKIAQRVHETKAVFLVDAAQSIRHEKVDVQKIGCDFLCFSGHKICAPTGIGVLWGKQTLFDILEPVEFGGEMVDVVTSGKTTFETSPLRFEAGTPNYVGAIALGEALDYLCNLGRQDIRDYEHKILSYAEQGLCSIEGLTIVGNPEKRAGCLSFVVDKVHPFDLATLLDTQGIALRSGNQCAQPLLHEVYGEQNVTRLTPAFYNTFEEIDACIETLKRIISILQLAAH